MSHAVSVCTLLLRLLKHHLFIPHKDMVTNLPFFLKNTLELSMLPPDTFFFLLLASVTPQRILGSHFSEMY